jgi:SAM-dependent methyltransferase
MRILINEDHPLQDMTKERKKNPARVRYRYALELLPKNRSGCRLVDLGGGRCEFIKMARQYGYEGLLVDGSERNVALAVAEGFTAILADLNELLPLKSESFDVAVLLDVVEHIIRAEQLIREIWRILKTKGILIISTPNISSLGSRIASLRGFPPKNEGYHFRFFNKYTFDTLLIGAGFTILKYNPIIGDKLRIANAIWRYLPYLHNKCDPLLARDLVVMARSDKKYSAELQRSREIPRLQKDQSDICD